MQQQTAPIGSLVDEALWSTDNYKAFLSYRREALAARMNKFIREKAKQ